MTYEIIGRSENVDLIVKYTLDNGQVLTKPVHVEAPQSEDDITNKIVDVGNQINL